MRMSDSRLVETDRNQRLELPKGSKISSQRISLTHGEEEREEAVQTARVLAKAGYVSRWGVIPTGEVYVETIIHDLVSVSVEIKTYPY